jgi:hypothetical protein
MNASPAIGDFRSRAIVERAGAQVPARRWAAGRGAYCLPGSVSARLILLALLQLSKNVRCFLNMRRLASSASSSDIAISERWPVLSACLTITRWRLIWTVNSAMNMRQMQPDLRLA